MYIDTFTRKRTYAHTGMYIHVFVSISSSFSLFAHALRSPPFPFHTSAHTPDSLVFVDVRGRKKFGKEELMEGG